MDGGRGNFSLPLLLLGGRGELSFISFRFLFLVLCLLFFLSFSICLFLLPFFLSAFSSAFLGHSLVLFLNDIPAVTFCYIVVCLHNEENL